MPQKALKIREMRELSNQEQLFVSAYMLHFKAFKAALVAKYDRVTAQKKAHLWIKPNGPKPHVAAAIKASMDALKAKHRVTATRIIAELEAIGFSNMADYMDFDHETGPLFRLDGLRRSQSGAIKKISVEEYKEGRGDAARDVKRVTLELHDKRAALIDLGKNIGMFGAKSRAPEQLPAPGKANPLGGDAGAPSPSWDTAGQLEAAARIERFQIELIPVGAHFRDDAETELVDSETILEDLQRQEQAAFQARMDELAPVIEHEPAE